jgi:hypothetical protein
MHISAFTADRKFVFDAPAAQKVISLFTLDGIATALNLPDKDSLHISLCAINNPDDVRMASWDITIENCISDQLALRLDRSREHFATCRMCEYLLNVPCT